MDEIEQARARRLEEKRAKAARLERAVGRHAAASEQAQQRAHEAVAGIEPGQPILVGHHSEKRHRAALKRSHRAMDKAVEEGRIAASLNAKLGSDLRAIERGDVGPIPSDHPDAILLLRGRIADEEARHEAVKELFAQVRKLTKGLTAEDEKRARLLAAGYSPAIVGWLFTFPWLPTYALKNRAGNMTRLRARLADLEARQQLAPREPVDFPGGLQVRETEDHARVQLVFPGKPSEEARQQLKARGFRWAPSEGAWQRLSTDEAWRVALSIARRIAGEPAEQGASAA